VADPLTLLSSPSRLQRAVTFETRYWGEQRYGAAGLNRLDTYDYESRKYLE
jgi:hypothetical protein